MKKIVLLLCAIFAISMLVGFTVQASATEPVNNETTVTDTAAPGADEATAPETDEAPAPETDEAPAPADDADSESKLPEILEIIMVVSFGVSWPANVMKSYKARTTKGKSLMFLILIEFGYVAGIASKFVKPDFAKWFADSWYVLIFYILNFIMVGADLILYYRNYQLDKKAEANAK